MGMLFSKILRADDCCQTHEVVEKRGDYCLPTLLCSTKEEDFVNLGQYYAWGNDIVLMDFSRV